MDALDIEMTEERVWVLPVEPCHGRHTIEGDVAIVQPLTKLGSALGETGCPD
jgi:hypothetical protein